MTLFAAKRRKKRVQIDFYPFYRLPFVVHADWNAVIVSNDPLRWSPTVASTRSHLFQRLV